VRKEEHQLRSFASRTLRLFLAYFAVKGFPLAVILPMAEPLASPGAGISCYIGLQSGVQPKAHNGEESYWQHSEP
jgi:hypothetical protein